MRKALLVWWQTYRRSVLHPAFLMFTLGIPGFLLLVGGAASYFILKATEGDTRPVGIVDTAQLLIPAQAWQPPGTLQNAVHLQSFSTTAEAQAALESGTIQAFYEVQPNYVTSGAVTEVATAQVDDRIREELQHYLTEGLLKATPDQKRERLTQGVSLQHRSLTDQREISVQLAFQWGLAFFVLMAFYLINSSSTSDMLHALREEKEKRTIEISLTSVTVEQLLVGKVGGIVSAGLTQFSVWLVGAALIVFIAWPVLHLGNLTLAVGPLADTLGLCLALLLPAYIMNAIGVIVISSLADLAGRGEQVVSLITNLLGTLAGPLTFIAISTPDNPLAIVLSILPFTSPMLMVTRYVQVVVPSWQIILAISLVWGLTLFNTLIAARVYRATWLLTGERNILRAVWKAVTVK
jgi:ABC-2 type transport system permease protein